MAKPRTAESVSVEDAIGDAVKALPRLPRHEPSEFEIMRSPVEYAPPTTRDDFTEAAAVVSADLPAERVKVVEQGLIALQQSHADRDRLRRENASLRVQLAETNARISGKEQEEHVIEERVRQCLADRDNAVAAAAELRGVLSSLAAILVGYYKQENHQHQPAEPANEPSKDQSA